MLVRANSTFLVSGRRRVNAGDLFQADDPIVAARRDLFTPLDDIERATARPGDKRAVKRPRHDGS